MRELENQVAVITGAGKGIGRAIAVGFAKAGAKVCCSARTESLIAGTASEIRKAAGEAIHVPCDVTNLHSVEQLFEATQRHFGGVDIVVVNAGIQPEGTTIEDSDPEQWKSIIDTNLMGAYHTARTAIPYLRARGGGKIIVVGSGAGHRVMPNSSAYGCSKAALWMLVRVLGQELAQLNICVNELIPGPVDTDMFRSGVSAANIPLIAQIEWFKKPEDVVPLAMFLATQPVTGPTGQTFNLARREC